MNETSPLEGHREEIEDWITEGKSYRHIARLVIQKGTATSEGSVRRAVRRWKLQTYDGPRFDNPGMRMQDDEAHITSDPRAWKSYLNNTDQLLEERGLNPDEWEIHSVIVNEWDWHGETYKQLKVHLKRKKLLSMVVPARVALGKVWKTFMPELPEGEPELVVFVGDQHAPFQDPELHRRFCEFLDDQRPERGVLMGDTVDYPNISRHPSEPDWQAETQECLDSGGQMLLDYREAAEATSWVKLPGNHEERMRRAIIDRLGDFYDLRPAQIASLPDLAPIHDPAYLLRLDELGIEYIRHSGSYKYAKHMVSPYLAAKHGDVARKGSGASAVITLSGLDHSIVIGHTHRQSLVQKTVEQITGQARLLQAGETGCMCRLEEGLGYAPGPDWSNGFLTAAIWPEGTFKLDLGTFVDSRLYWRSERY